MASLVRWTLFLVSHSCAHMRLLIARILLVLSHKSAVRRDRTQHLQTVPDIRQRHIDYHLLRCWKRVAGLAVIDINERWNGCISINCMHFSAHGRDRTILIFDEMGEAVEMLLYDTTSGDTRARCRSARAAALEPKEAPVSHATVSSFFSHFGRQIRVCAVIVFSTPRLKRFACHLGGDLVLKFDYITQDTYL